MKAFSSYLSWRNLGFIMISAIIFIAVIITTHRGNLLLISAIEKRVPTLRISLIEGSLLFSPRFSHIEFSTGDVNVEIKQASINWDLGCLWQSKLCVESLSTSELLITAIPSSKQSNIEPLIANVNKLSSSSIDLGLDIDITELIVKTMSINLNKLKITFKDIDTSLSLASNNLIVPRLNMSSIVIYNSQDSNNQTVTDLGHSSTTKTPNDNFDLNALVTKLQQSLNQLSIPYIPLNLTLQQSQINSLIYHYKNNEPENESITVKQVSSQFVQHEQEISALSLSGAYEANTFNLDGALSLEPKFNHQLILSFDTNNDLIGESHLKVSSQGNVDQLTLNGHVSGDIETTLTGQLSLTQQNLPFNVTANWQPMTLATMALDLDTGRLFLKGDITDYALEFNGGATLPNYPSVAGNINAHGSTSSLSIDNATLALLQGDVTLSGLLSWENDITLQSKITMNEVKPHAFWPQYQGQLSGSLDVNTGLKGSGDNNYWYINIANMDVSGQWLSRQLDLSGRITGRQSQSKWGHWVADSLLLKHANNQLAVNGTVSDSANLIADISIDNIGTTLPMLISKNPGEVQGRLTLAGPIEALKLSAAMTAKHIDYKSKNISLEQATITANAVLSETLPFDIDVVATQLTLPTILSSEVPNDLTLSLSGNKAHHVLTTNLTSNDLNISTEIVGELTSSRWHGTIENVSIKANMGVNEQHLTLTSPLTISANLKAKSLNISKHCWLSSTKNNTRNGTLCLASPFSIDTQLIRSNEAIINLDHFSIAQLQPYLPKAHVVTGDVSGHLSFQLFSRDKLSLSSNIQWTNGLIESDFGDSLVSHNITKLSVSAAIDRSLANIIAHLSSPTLGVIDVSMVSNIFNEQPFVSGHIQSHGLELAPYRPFLKYVSLLDGKLSVNAGFSGDLQQQQIFGQLTSSNITIASDKLPSRIDNLNTQVSFTGASATLDSAFNLASGNGALKGAIDWKNELLATLALTGNELALSPSKGVDVVFSPELTLTLSPERAKIRGKVNIDSANVKIESLPQSAVGLSDDVTIKQQALTKRAIPIDIDVNALLGDQVKVNAFGLKSNVVGALNIIQNKTQPLSTYGELTLKDAKYKAFGQQLTIEQGQIIFTGSTTNPVINIKAIRNPKETNDNVIAGVYVNGAVDKPALTVFTVPVKEQQEAFSYLIYGYKSGSGEAFGQDLAISMLVNSGLGGASKMIGNIGSAVGIDNFNVTTSGSGDNTRVEFSGSIGPNLQLRYGVGVFDALPEVGLRYQVNQRLFIDFINNTSQALDLLYQFSFD